MTFLEVLQSHRGGLLRIKSELYWYDGGLRVGTRGRVCLILDAAALDAAFHTADAFGEFAATTVSSARPTAAAADRPTADRRGTRCAPQIARLPAVCLA